MPPHLTAPLLNKIPYIKHGFFTRQGGKSSGPYATLNTGFEKGDGDDAVFEKRRRICDVFGLSPKDLALVRQEHTDSVYTVTEPFPRNNTPIGDALITSAPALLLGVQTADCVPILLADKTRPLIAAVHSGWQGAIGGLIENTLASLEKQGGKRENIVAALGPCIWQDSYEVGLEFFDTFDCPQFFKAGKRPGYYQFDLPGYVTSRLKKAGVLDIDPSPANTFSDEKRFFSYRRKTLNKEGAFGNQISVICIRSDA